METFDLVTENGTIAVRAYDTWSGGRSYELRHPVFAVPTVRVESDGRITMSSTGNGGLTPAMVDDLKAMLDKAVELAASR